jgi:small subunit ribosomal protein S17
MEGVILSDRMDKTVVVEVTRLRRHQLYKKVIRQRRKLMAHDEGETCRVGDRVRIVESRPLSRHKHWVVETILERVQ